MSISIDEMREEVIRAYPGDIWREKTNAMSDSQVIAIYNSIVRTGRLGKKKSARQVYYQGKKLIPGSTHKTDSKPPRTPCKRLFVDETESCEGGKQVGFDEVLRKS